MHRIVVFGLGPLFKGGIAHYTQSLAEALAATGDAEVHLVSWTAPYPSLIPHSFLNEATVVQPVSNVSVHYVTNFNDLRSWRDTCKFIALLHPDMVVFEWFTAVQCLPVAWMARQLRKETDIRIVFDLHLIKSVRHTSLVQYLTRRAIRDAHHYVVHSVKAACDLKELFPQYSFLLTENEIPMVDDTTRLILQLFHPAYDRFRTEKPVDVEEVRKELHLKQHVFLFFGFINKYKGLHHVIDAFAALCRERDDVSLLIVGESSWQTQVARMKNNRLKSKILSMVKSMFLSEADDEEKYHPLDKIAALGLEDKVTVVNRYVSDTEVARYFSVADYVMLYYEAANGSGVEATANAFGVPVLCTRVGHFPETVEDGVNGYMAEVDNLTSMIDTMRRAVEHPLPHDPACRLAGQFAWDKYAAVLDRLLATLPDRRIPFETDAASSEENQEA